ncbi:MAG TPA: hypothetical protein VJO35_03315 [Terriglobales bacterium]|nr:hypothetical protein [Terriglobales bacterium]
MAVRVQPKHVLIPRAQVSFLLDCRQPQLRLIAKLDQRRSGTRNILRSNKKVEITKLPHRRVAVEKLCDSGAFVREKLDLALIKMMRNPGQFGGKTHCPPGVSTSAIANKLRDAERSEGAIERRKQTMVLGRFEEEVPLHRYGQQASNQGRVFALTAGQQ